MRTGMAVMCETWGVGDLQHHQLLGGDLSTGEIHYLAHHCAIIKTRATKTSLEHILVHQVYEKSIAKVYDSTDKAFLMTTLPHLADCCIAIKSEV